MSQRPPKASKRPEDAANKPASNGDAWDREPNGSPLDDMMNREPHPLPPAPPEPPGTCLDDLDALDAQRTGPEDGCGDGDVTEAEPIGDDLSWAVLDAEEAQEPSWLPHLEEPPATSPLRDADASRSQDSREPDSWEPDSWERDEDDVAQGMADAVWAGLQDERLIVLGIAESAALSGLGRPVVLARPSPLHDQSVLRTSDPSLLEQGTVQTDVQLGTVVVSVVLQVESASDEVLIVGRDVLAGRFIVDPAQRGLLGAVPGGREE